MTAIPASESPDNSIDELHAELRALRARVAELERVRSLVDSPMVGIGIGIREGGRVTEANDALLDIIGWDRAAFEAGAIPWDRLTPPEYYASDEKAAAQLQALGRCTPYEKEYVRRDGRRVPVLVGGGALDGGPGGGTAFFVLDLTERRQAEERTLFLAEAGRVLASSLDYETTLASMADLAVPAIADWCIIDLREGDDGAGELRRLAVAHGDPARVELAWQLSAEAGALASAPGIAAVLASGRPCLRDDAGDAFAALGIVSALSVPLEARARIVGVLSLLQAESGRRFTPADVEFIALLARRAAIAVDNARLYREARGAVRHRDASLAMLDAMLDAAPLGMGFLDRGLRFVRVNEALARINRLPALDHIGRSLREVIPDWAGKVEPLFHRVIETGAPLIDLEFSGPLRAGDTDTHHWMASYYPVRDGSGEVEWVGVVIMDVTERKRSEAALRHTQKLESIGVLAGGIAHDFNNLLTGILGNASLALRTLPPGTGARTRPLLDDVIAAAERAAALTSQLLAYAGKGRFFIQPVDLAALVRELVPLVRSSIPRKVAVELGLAAALPPVEGDASQLQQLVMNLVLNGAEAIEDRPGTVTVTVRTVTLDAAAVRAFAGFDLAPGRYLELEVTDTGVGMSEATMAQIFDPFFTTKFTGRGLGLAAALGIVRGHRGALAVRSTPGEGSTFTVVLPAMERRLAAGTAVAETPPAAEPAPAPARGTILVADDEETLRDLARVALEEQGYEVLTAANGQEAIDVLRADPDRVRLVLLDLTMPIMGGEEAIRHLRALRPDLPVIVTSGYGETTALEQFDGAGAIDFLQKPFTVDRLGAAVEEALR